MRRLFGGDATSMRAKHFSSASEPVRRRMRNVFHTNATIAAPPRVAYLGRQNVQVNQNGQHRVQRAGGDSHACDRCRLREALHAACNQPSRDNHFLRDNFGLLPGRGGGGYWSTSLQKVVFSSGRWARRALQLVLERAFAIS